MVNCIEKITAREIFDSRGNPTVEVDVLLTDGTLGRASVPSGASTGDLEALELRDGGSRLNGKGVKQAVNNVNTTIADKLKGMSPYNQRNIDNVLIELDGTKDKSKLGANALLGVSMAVCRAAAISQHIPLYRYIGGINLEMPQPYFNVINGGAHADSGIDTQEFLLVPVAPVSFREKVEMVSVIYQNLKTILKSKGLSTAIGDEGGFAPKLESTENVLEILQTAIISSGYQLKDEVAITLDPASSEFYVDGMYQFEGQSLSSDEMINYWEDLVSKYPIVSLEDALSEHDWDGWAKLTERLGDKVQLVGDDIFVTNPTIFKQGIEKGIGNSILIKVNQIGTLTETIETVQMAKENGYTTMISHRSGETGDTFISDLSVGLSAGQIKSGSMARSERVEKYNNLIRIEEEIMTLS